METITWIITGVAVTIFLIGVIATIVIKVDVIPKWKTISKILIWVIGLLIFRLVVWSLWNKDWSRIINTSPVQPVAANSGTQVVIPKEKWSFKWITPYKSQDLSVEIVENRNGIFKAVLHDTNGHGIDERVAGLTMCWEGENLIGTWTDYADSEGGNAYLYKASNNLWSGWWECNNGKTKVHIEMKKN